MTLLWRYSTGNYGMGDALEKSLSRAISYAGLKVSLVSGVLDDEWYVPTGFLFIPFSRLSLLGCKG